MKQAFKSLVAVLVIGALTLAAMHFTTSMQQERQRGRRGAGAGADGPVPVVAAQARIDDVPVWLEGVGTAKARNTVTVRAQVEGKILSIDFKEGQDVKKGDVLAHIDPVTYQAQYDQAVAKKALDEALLANSKRDLERYAKVGTLAVSQQQIDTQRALVAQQEAQVKSDQAAIDNVHAILGYTTVVAPIDGRTGIRQIDVGNIVRTSDTPIVTLTEVRPISVMFTLPQQQLPDINKARADKPLRVDALETGHKTVLDTGELQVVDNQVDQTTGTIRLKADFPNKDLQLWPGQFVNVRLLLRTLEQVVVIPTSAVQRGPDGTFVYVHWRREQGFHAPRHRRPAGRRRRCHLTGPERLRTSRHRRIRTAEGRRRGQGQRARRQDARGHRTAGRAAGRCDRLGARQRHRLHRTRCRAAAADTRRNR